MFKSNYNWLPDFVYGSIDGIITTFAVVSAVEGGALPVVIILIMGFANLFADGFSMAAGKYLSDKAELDQDTEHHSKINPVLGAWSTFIAFIILGAVPLIAYVIQPWLQLTSSVTFRLACILTLLALFFVGFLKGYFVKQNRFYAGFKTMMIGAMAAGISYGIGFYIESLVS
jgi:vacuolar iron transporter family protein